MSSLGLRVARSMDPRIWDFSVFQVVRGSPGAVRRIVVCESQCATVSFRTIAARSQGLAMSPNLRWKPSQPEHELVVTPNRSHEPQALSPETFHPCALFLAGPAFLKAQSCQPNNVSLGGISGAAA